MAVKMIYMKRYISDMPHIITGRSISIDGLGIKLNDLDLSTQVALLTFFRTAVLQN